jgi:hypothetical protein
VESKPIDVRQQACPKKSFYPGQFAGFIFRDHHANEDNQVLRGLICIRRSRRMSKIVSGVQSKLQLLCSG